MVKYIFLATLFFNLKGKKRGEMKDEGRSMKWDGRGARVKQLEILSNFTQCNEIIYEATFNLLELGSAAL
jgi:hypothetical protein